MQAGRVTNLPHFPAVRVFWDTDFGAETCPAPGKPGWAGQPIHRHTHRSSCVLHTYPKCSVTHRAQGLVGLRLGRGERGSLWLYLPDLTKLICLLCPPSHLPWPVLPSPIIRGSSAWIGAMGSTYFKEADSPTAERKGKHETPRFLPGPGKLGPHPSHHHGHTFTLHIYPHTSQTWPGSHHLPLPSPLESKTEERERNVSLHLCKWNYTVCTLFFVWLLLLINILRFIHVVIYTNTYSFLLLSSSISWLYHNFPIHLLIIICVHVLAKYLGVE